MAGQERKPLRPCGHLADAGREHENHLRPSKADENPRSKTFAVKNAGRVRPTAVLCGQFRQNLPPCGQVGCQRPKNKTLDTALFANYGRKYTRPACLEANYYPAGMACYPETQIISNVVTTEVLF
jgi:hypothetical protein